MKTERGQKRVITGIVVSDKMDKSIVVKSERLVQHPIYKKYHRISKKFMAHDPENTCHIGDKVSIIENRPLSKNKTWRLWQIIERAK